MRVVTRSEQRESTRLTVLETAEGLFLEQGFEATSIRDIAAGAGVSVGTVMSVGDKQTLLAAVFARGIALVDEARAASPATGPLGSAAEESATVVERILALVEPYATLFASRIDLARSYGAVLMTGRHGEAVFGELADRLRADIIGILRGEAAHAHPDPSGAARAIYLAYMGALFVWAGSGAQRADRFMDDVACAVRAIVEPAGSRP